MSAGGTLFTLIFDDGKGNEYFPNRYIINVKKHFPDFGRLYAIPAMRMSEAPHPSVGVDNLCF